MRSVLLVLALALGLAPPAHAAWRRPVPGAVTRAFVYGPDPFRAGWHRGVDLSARVGARVRAACAGRVATARPGLVTLRCGAWRVTHLPMATVSVHRGEVVAAGAAIGTVGPSADHTGLHLGVRRAGVRFGYVDPLPFLGGAAPPPIAPPIPRAGPRPAPPPGADPVPRVAPRPASPRADHPARRVAPRPAAPRADPAPRAASRPASLRADPGPRADPATPRAQRLAEPRRAPPPVGVRVFAPDVVRALAPWPAWVGLAMLLLGAAGRGVRVGVRRRRARVRAAVPSAP